MWGWGCKETMLSIYKAIKISILEYATWSHIHNKHYKTLSAVTLRPGGLNDHTS